MKQLTTHLNEDFKLSKHTKIFREFDIEKIQEMYDGITEVTNKVKSIFPNDYCEILNIMIKFESIKLDDEILNVKSTYEHIGGYVPGKTPKHQIIDLSTVNNDYSAVIYLDNGYDAEDDFYFTELYLSFSPLDDFNNTVIKTLDYVATHMIVKPNRVVYYVGFTKIDHQYFKVNEFPEYINFLNHTYQRIKGLVPDEKKFENKYDILYFFYSKRALSNMECYILDEYKKVI